MLKKESELSRNNLLLLISLITIIFILPTIEGYSIKNLVSNILISLLLLQTVFAVKTHRKKLIAFALSCIILRWIPGSSDPGTLKIISNACHIVFIVFIVIMLIVQIAKSKKVSTNVILESVNGYLLLGFIGAVFIVLVEIFQTGSFNTSNADELEFAEAIYYSFVTMTTLGYGDITPVSNVARSVSIFFSVAGQLYLTILVALLIGKFLVQYPAREQ